MSEIEELKPRIAALETRSLPPDRFVAIVTQCIEHIVAPALTKAAERLKVLSERIDLIENESKLSTPIRDDKGRISGLVSGKHGSTFAKVFERLEALEQQAQSWQDFGYVGVWGEGKNYQRGNLVTHAGGLWHCDRPNKDKPGTNSAWTLAVKSGQR